MQLGATRLLPGEGQSDGLLPHFSLISIYVYVAFLNYHSMWQCNNSMELLKVTLMKSMYSHEKIFMEIYEKINKF